MTSLRIDGSPEHCRETAGRLRSAQDRLERVFNTLATVADQAARSWQGMAADAFQAALRERLARVQSHALVAGELAAGLDLMYDGLTVALEDMRRAREAASAAGIPVIDDCLPTVEEATTGVVDPVATELALHRALGFASLARAAERSVQESWRVTVSAALRELGVRTVTEVSESDDGGFWGFVRDGVEKVEDWAPAVPIAPGIRIGNFDDGLSGVVGGLYGSTLVGVVLSQATSRWADDSGRDDLDVAERLGRAGLVGGTSALGGLGAMALCRRVGIPTADTTCARLGGEGGGWVGNELVEWFDER